jgi:hypothetical protein
MVRRTDRPLRIVRVSFETTGFSAQHLIEAYTQLVPTLRRQHLRALREKVGSHQIKPARRRGEA